MKPTAFFEDFVFYYQKAQVLEDKNLLLAPATSKTGDPLMDSVTIYDTVHRRHAGFSKALEDVHGCRVRKDLVKYSNWSRVFDSKVFHFLHLFHRFTGSGASFQPTLLPDGSRNPGEHGYKNNHVEALCQSGHTVWTFGDDPLKAMISYIVNCKTPMVTSTGNQPPSLKNGDPTKYRLAQQYYFDNFAEPFVKDYMTFLINNEYQNNKPIGIKEAVDFCCNWHKERKFKRWHFVLTAFVMDTAEYYPELVDPTSHCYYGANCIKSFNLMFDKEKGDPKNDQFYENCMTQICNRLNNANPYDVEDVCCDYIRYIKEYVPKGYESLPQELRVNNSNLKVGGLYPSEIQERINLVLG